MRTTKTLIAGCALSALATGLQAQQDDTRWVSDELSTFVRSGPSDEYRIIGTLTSGEPVTVLETQGDYSRVQAEDDNETAWILSDELQAEESAQQRLPELEAEIESLTEELDGINEEWQSRMAGTEDTLADREARIDELEDRNAELDSRYQSAQETLREQQARLDTQEEDLLIRYFMYGGGVAGAGLVVGLIVPHLPRRRKKRDRWF
ncbi:TIGR04211 family SH3 domain-containing protein [Aidingimonas lacisalsi]|uniref:TIGR04211 family SH3 domain-containing protein n=1 Tax=Aidingimonas lacisalsi TaxID=2604086 RepID=UPI0011D1BF76|nr:TIGR04211 family SH3 domain-containing protein [Aidingimonas lacisalsi]